MYPVIEKPESKCKNEVYWYSYCLNNPLSYTDPGGNTRVPVQRELGILWDGFDDIASGKAFRKYGYANTMAFLGMHNAGPNSSIGDGSYNYNWYTGQYKNDVGITVDYNEVHNNYILPNSIFSFSGQIAQDLVGFLLNTGSGSLPSKSEYNAALTAGLGGAVDLAYQIANTLNEFNPIAQLWDVIAYAFTGKDRFGNSLSQGQAYLKTLGVIPLPIGKIGNIVGKTMTADQIALKELIDEVTLGGRKVLSASEANAAKELARSVHYPGFKASPLDLSPINNHWIGGPHIHIPGVGNGHIPIEP